MSALTIDLIINNIIRFLPNDQIKSFRLIDKQWCQHVDYYYPYQLKWKKNHKFVKRNSISVPIPEVHHFFKGQFCRKSGLFIDLRGYQGKVYLCFYKKESSAFFKELDIPLSVAYERHYSIDIKLFVFPKQFTTDDCSRLMINIVFDRFDSFNDHFIDYSDLGNIKIFTTLFPKSILKRNTFLNLLNRLFDILLSKITLLDLPFVHHQKLLTTLPQNCIYGFGAFPLQNSNGEIIVHDSLSVHYFSGASLIHRFQIINVYFKHIACNNYLVFDNTTSYDVHELSSARKILIIPIYQISFICDVTSLTKHQFLIRFQPLHKKREVNAKWSLYYFVDISKGCFKSFRMKTIISSQSMVEQLDDDNFKIHCVQDKNFYTANLNLQSFRY